MNKQIIFLVVTSVLYIIAIALALAWFGWKLLLVLFFWTWANNVQGKGGKSE